MMLDGLNADRGGESAVLPVPGPPIRTTLCRILQELASVELDA